jgi:hypothetical protein
VSEIIPPEVDLSEPEMNKISLRVIEIVVLILCALQNAAKYVLSRFFAMKWQRISCTFGCEIRPSCFHLCRFPECCRSFLAFCVTVRSFGMNIGDPNPEKERMLQDYEKPEA